MKESLFSLAVTFVLLTSLRFVIYLMDYFNLAPTYLTDFLNQWRFWIGLIILFPVYYLIVERPKKLKHQDILKKN